MSFTPEIGLGYTILRRAALSPERKALTFEGKTSTFREFGQRILKLAALLRAGGVCRGDRVGYIGLNHPAFLETLYACSCLGAIFVPLNFRLTGPEMRYITNDAGIHTMLADNGLRSLVDQERDTLVCQRFISIEDEAANWESLESLLQDSQPLELIEQVDADEVAFIMYTSGTTGLPKGAMLTHGNLFWNSANTAYGEDFMGTTTLTCAPLFHIGGLNVTTLPSLARGIEVVLIRSFDAAEVLAALEKYQVSTMFGAPTMFLMMSQHDSFASTDLSHIGAFVVGGAPVPVPLINLYSERDVRFCQGYGLTETSPFATMLETSMALEKVGSAGRPPMFTDVRIVDGENNPLPAGEHGEVCVRGPNVLKGYWNRPEATADAIDAQGWFHSGDIGYFDNQGYLFLCDRVKDMVISGGENIYPAEVESILYGHSSVVEVAVIGLPDEKWGEAVTAVAVLKQDVTLDLEELREFASQSLAKYKLPSRLYFLDELPRNPAGKVQKFKIKDELVG